MSSVGNVTPPIDLEAIREWTQPCHCAPGDAEGCVICACHKCNGSGLITIYDYDGNGSDADDQPCPVCALEREALSAVKPCKDGDSE